MKRQLLLATVLLLACRAVCSAQQPEYEAYQAAVGNEFILYRGMQAPGYNFAANGHPYWESPDFVSGDLVFEGNTYYDVLLNIDAFSQQAFVRLPGSQITVALSPVLATSLQWGGRHFVGVGPEDGVLPEGYYEVIGTGPEQVYKRVDKKLAKSSNNVNGDGIGYYDANYNPNVTRYFAIRRVYYFRDAEGRFSRFRGKAALIRKFPGRRKEIRQAVSAARLDLPGSSFDAFCQEVLKTVSR